MEFGRPAGRCSAKDRQHRPSSPKGPWRMSWRATAYIKPLITHADGTRLTAREKLILFVLADSHNDDYDCAWPGLAKASAQSLTSRRRFIELVKRLELRGTISIQRREGRSNIYRFPGLVQSSHPPTKNEVPELHYRGATATAPGGAIAIAPEPIGIPQGATIQPASRPTIDLALAAIRESQRTGESADEIMKRLREGSHAN